MKKTLNEAQLRDIVCESVKKVLNEISPELLYRAANSANGKGRYNQSYAFGKEADSRMTSEYSGGENNNILSATAQEIIYTNEDSRLAHMVVINNFGEYKTYDTGKQVTSNKKLNGEGIPNSVKTTSKQTARKIALWFSKNFKGLQNPYSDNNPYTDWHNWCRL